MSAPQPVLIVGAGLLGTSIGLALSGAGREVWLSDADPDHVRTAAGLGAGVAYVEGAVPALVVVAVPPGAIAPVVATALGSGAVVTDVGSVKAHPLAEIAALVDGARLARYCGSHPMAGSERSGPLAASESLFEGRPWAITPHDTTAPEALAAVEDLVATCGAVALRFAPDHHDQAVARTSHLPHLMAVLVARRLADAAPDQLALSGQGVRDVTRIAGSDPVLWRQIIGGNVAALRALLSDVRTDLERMIEDLDDSEALQALLQRGVEGTRAIPGKHGGEAAPTEAVFVSVPDHPGELARLFGDVGEIGTNIEDLRIDHDPGRPVGLAELQVAPAAAAGLRDALESRGWAVHR
ncbi:prephenate dehydrogenase [Nocardioides mangrovicus]|uniref:Prephenate dehydrogenase n=1 Tax=Nocardioides mangrovicus TaxID=2478913 RepID=A0A3L8NZK9_9ACTN|nr:prephenate dehydrogenase [Nocardioides mangrovicus]RLV48630.1 prephenate dehydrogenase [Nocardioides mangrovicus]